MFIQQRKKDFSLPPMQENIRTRNVRLVALVNLVELVGREGGLGLRGVWRAAVDGDAFGHEHDCMLGM